jgi:hypothetical protein
MSAVVSTAVAAVSAVTAVAGLLAYLYFGRRSDLVAAREEALALAETRRQVIRELRATLASAERAKAESERRARELQSTLDRTRAQAREDAYRTQHFYATALAQLGKDLLAALERKPPDVDAALDRVRRLTGGTRTRKPTRP